MFQIICILQIISLTLIQVINCQVQCGVQSRSSPSTKVIGGTETRPLEFPWQASIRNRGRHFCGGSLINDQWIVTAAHCVDDKTNANYKIYLGDHSLSQTEPTEKIFDVIRIIPHENYRPPSLANDIALIKLARKVDFANSKPIVPICLVPKGSPDFAGRTCTVSGWGSTRTGGPTPDKLMKVDLEVLSNQKCNERQNWSGSVGSGMVCAALQGKGACNGDSGGPLECRKTDGTWEQIGIVSWGAQQCATRPSVFTRVSSYIDWINQKVAQNRRRF